MPQRALRPGVALPAIGQLGDELVVFTAMQVRDAGLSLTCLCPPALSLFAGAGLRPCELERLG